MKRTEKEAPTYIFFDYYLDEDEGYFRVIYLHDGYIFVKNEVSKETAFAPIDEAKQKEILLKNRHAVIDEDEDVIKTMKYEIEKQRRALH